MVNLSWPCGLLQPIAWGGSSKPEPEEAPAPALLFFCTHELQFKSSYDAGDHLERPLGEALWEEKGPETFMNVKGSATPALCWAEPVGIPA